MLVLYELPVRSFLWGLKLRRNLRLERSVYCCFIMPQYPVSEWRFDCYNVLSTVGVFVVKENKVFITSQIICVLIFFNCLLMYLTFCSH